MKNQVKVAVHPETKAVITVNKNKPEYGTIRVDQTTISMENGFVNKSNRSAFIAGKIEDLQALGLSAGTMLDGKIIRTESREPMYAGHEPKLNPTTGEVVLIDNAPVYFKDEFTADLNAKDSLIRASVAVAAESANLAD